MKIYIYIISVLILRLSSFGAIEVTNLDISNYPSIKAGFYAFDTSGQLLRNLSPGMILLTDNGINIPPIDIINPDIIENDTFSLLISIDLALSNIDGQISHFYGAKSFADTLIKESCKAGFEVALGSFDYTSYLHRDYSRNIDSLISYLPPIIKSRGSYFDAAFFPQPAGAFRIIERAKHRPILIIITEGLSKATTDSIITESQKRGLKVVALSMTDNLSSDLQEISEKSGGFWLKNISSYADYQTAALVIIHKIMGYSPVEVTYNALVDCITGHEIIIKLTQLALTDSVSYYIPEGSEPRLEALPSDLSFGGVLPPGYKELLVKIKAYNKNILIDSISISDNHLSISKGDVTNFLLPKDSELELLIRFTPTDSALTFANLIIHSKDACNGEKLRITAGFPNTPPHNKTLTITNPDCGGTLVVGDTVNITWEGLLPRDVIQLEYTTNGGKKWDTLAYDINGLQYKWVVPDISGDSCLIRAFQLWPNNIGQTMNFRHELGVNSAFFNSDESLIVTASDDTTVRVWNSNTGQELRRYKGHTQPVLWAEFSPDDKYIISCGQDSIAILWDTQSGALLRKFKGHNWDVRAARFSRDSKEILTAGRDGYAFTWDISSGKILDTLDYNPAQLWFAEYSPDGQFAIITGNDKIVKLIRLSDNSIDKYFDTGIIHGGLNVHGTFSPDGKKVSVSSWFGKAVVFDTRTGDTLFSVQHTDSLGNLTAVFFSAFDATGDTLLTSGFDHTAIMWNGRNGKFIVNFLEHASSVKSGVFNFDGSRVLTASWDFNAKIWNRNKRDIQMDTSDCFFRIKRATINSGNFSFGQMPIGEVVDTIIKPFIVNPNDFPFKIRSIKIKGIASRDYTMLDTHAPVIIDSMGRINLELRFRPSNLGIRPAKIEIEIPGKTYVLDLIGEGVLPSLSKSSPFINFGAVELNDYLDLMSNPIVINNSIDPITVDSVRIEGPEHEPFGFTGISYPVKLNPGDFLYSLNRFTPKYLHRTEGQLVFYHDGFGSPTKIPLFGEGIIRFTDTAYIYLDTITANAGDVIDLPVHIRYVSSNEINSGMAAISFNLSFNPTILEPLGDNYTDLILNDEIRTIEILANYHSPDTLISLIKFRTALGNDSLTHIDIENISIVSYGKVKIFSSPGLVKIGDVCREGGARLINPGNRMFDISVNQVISGDEGINLGIESIEFGKTLIQLVDVIGNLKYESSFFAEPKAYTLNISSHDLPDGIYYLTVQTPTISEVRKIIRLR